MSSEVWSYGGGVQTIAILCLIADGKLPMPELAIMADTSRERTSTWSYLEQHAKPLMDSIGLSFHVASHELATVDLYAKNGNLLIPAFTASGGKLPTFCSNEWKRRVVMRYLRSIGYGPKNPVRMWLGISLDEIERMRPSDTGWVEHHYPLILAVRRRRIECEEIITRFGLPVPPKSTCWMCPHLNNEEWDEIRENQPGDFARAVELERVVSADDTRGGIYLHRSMKPIDCVNFSENSAPAPGLFDGCDSGYCWT